MTLELNQDQKYMEPNSSDVSDRYRYNSFWQSYNINNKDNNDDNRNNDELKVWKSFDQTASPHLRDRSTTSCFQTMNSLRF